MFSLLIISSLSFRTILSSKVGKGSFAFVIPPVNTRFSTAINGKNPALLRELIDSFNENLLDYPTYTKPRNYKGMKVPEVLLSGDHKKIDEWRKEQRLLVTKEKRPDLLRKKMILKKGGMKKSGFKISMDDVKIKFETKEGEF